MHPALVELEEKLRQSAAGRKAMLIAEAPECFAEQRHTDSGSRERIYWNYGYLVALRDVAELLRELNATPS